MKRSRAGKPKTRYGCKTCKRRHVKCDETRPACSECTRLGLQCHGYSKPISSPTSHYERLWNLAPAGRISTASTEVAPVKLQWIPYDEDSKASEKKARRQLTLRRLTSTLFASQQEQQYFDYYRNVTARQIAGWFQRDVWAFLMLQAAHDQIFVRHSLVAIGAMAKSLEISRSESTADSAEDVKTANQHRQFAYRQYGLAIGLIQKSVEEIRRKGQDNIRPILLSCLLTVCFEGFFGKREDVSSQVAQVVKILDEWTRKQSPILASKDGLCSPAPHIVEDELYHAIALLDIKSMYPFDGGAFSNHFEMSLVGSSTIAAMPAAFKNVREAEPYFSLIARRALHFLNAATGLAQTRNIQAMRDAGTNSQSAEYLGVELHERWQDLVTSGFNKYLCEMYRWRAAFQPVISAAGKERGSRDYIHAMVLESYTKSVIIRFAGGEARDVDSSSISHFSLDTTSPSSIVSDNVVKLSDIALNMKIGCTTKYQGNADLDLEIAVDAASMSTAGRVRNAELGLSEIRPPDHILQGVEYGFLNPLEAFGERKGAGPWYQEETMLWYDISGVDTKREKNCRRWVT